MTRYWRHVQLGINGDILYNYDNQTNICITIFFSNDQISKIVMI